MQRLALVSLVLLSSCAALPAAASAAGHAGLDSEVRSFVLTRYVHGVPYSQARALGDEAIPALLKILEDGSLEAYWQNAVVTLGYIGSPKAVEPLLDFLHRPRGEVSVSVFRAYLSVFPALGHIAQGGDDVSLQTLIAWTKPGEAKAAEVSLRHNRYAGEALAEVSARMAFLGLGISGRPEALHHLREEASKESLRPDWVDNVVEAIDLAERVQTLGAEAVFSEGEQQ